MVAAPARTGDRDTRAMSQQNMELVRRVLGEAQHHPPALWDLLDDEVLWELGQLALPDAGPAQWHGPAGVQEFFRRWIGPIDEWGYEVGEMIDAGDSVVAHIHQWGRGKAAAPQSNRSSGWSGRSATESSFEGRTSPRKPRPSSRQARARRT
jgi:SnoaL-like domain